MMTKTSCEPTCCGPYDWQMIYQYMVLDLPYCVVAENLDFNASTVYQIVATVI